MLDVSPGKENEGIDQDVAEGNNEGTHVALSGIVNVEYHHNTRDINCEGSGLKAAGMEHTEYPAINGGAAPRRAAAARCWNREPANTSG